MQNAIASLVTAAILLQSPLTLAQPKTPDAAPASPPGTAPATPPGTVPATAPDAAPPPAPPPVSSPSEPASGQRGSAPNTAGPQRFSVGVIFGIVPAHDSHIWANHPDYGGLGIHWSFKSGPVAGMTLNFWTRPFLLLRGYCDYLYLASASTENEHHVMSLGAAIFYVFRVGRMFQIRLGFGLGANVMKSTVLDYWGLGVAVGVNPSLSLEFALGLGRSTALVIGYKFNSMPWSEGDKVSWAPISMVFAGLEFGR